MPRPTEMPRQLSGIDVLGSLAYEDASGCPNELFLKMCIGS